MLQSGQLIINPGENKMTSLVLLPYYAKDWATNTNGQVFNAKVSKYLNNVSSLFAPPDYYQAPESKQETPQTVRPIKFTYVDNSWRWGSSRTVVHHYHEDGKKSEEKKDNSGLLLLIGLIGSGIALGSSWFVGDSYKKMNVVQLELGKISEEGNKLSKAIENQNDSDDKELLTELISDTEALANDQISAAKWDFALKVTLLVGGLLLFSGAGLAYAGGALAAYGTVMIIAGAVDSLVSGCGLLIRKGLTGKGSAGEKLEHKVQHDLDALKAIKAPYYIDQFTGNLHRGNTIDVVKPFGSTACAPFIEKPQEFDEFE